MPLQDKKPDKTIKEEFLFGTAGELKLDPNQRKPVIVNVDTDELAHPNVRLCSCSFRHVMHLLLFKSYTPSYISI